MAYNPFSSFRKHQKFWMAFMTLVAMVTFVLCTGVGGDLSDMIMRWFRGRGGNVLVKVDGRSYYFKDLDDLKHQRQLADKFVRKALEIHQANIIEFKKRKDLSAEDRQKHLPEAELALEQIDKRLRDKKNYFETGTTVEDLADFIMWRNVADRLGVNLLDQSVRDLFNEEILAHPQGRFGFFGAEHHRQVFYAVRQNMREVSDGAVMRALRDEFLVRIAKLCIGRAQTAALFRGQKMEHTRLYFPVEVRDPLTPYELWDFYKQNRAEYSVGIVPVAARDFAEEKFVGKPTAGELEALYKARREKAADPSSPAPGLQTPELVRVEYLMGDPQEPFYQTPAKVAVLAGQTYPAVWLPTEPVMMAAARYAAVEPRQQKLLDDKLQAEGKTYLTAPAGEINFAWARFARESKMLATKLQVIHQGMPIVLPTPDPKSKPFAFAEPAALVAALAGSDPGSAAALFQAAPWIEFADEHKRLIVREKDNRDRLAGSMLALGSTLAASTNVGFVPAQATLRPDLLYALWKPAELAKFRDNLQKQKVDGVAEKWVQSNMAKVRGELASANKDTLQRRLAEYVEKYGLVRVRSADYYSQYNIDKAPELAPLKEAYERYYPYINWSEQREGKPTALKADQFYRLFFDNGESFSAATKEYAVRPWPPEIMVRPATREKKTDDDEAAQQQRNDWAKMVKDAGGALAVRDLFTDAPKPVLFWKTSSIPKSTSPDVPLDKLKQDYPDTYDRLVELWRLEKARDTKARQRAAEVAQVLKNAAADNLEKTVRSLAGKQALFLAEVARLVGSAAPQADQSEHRIYRDFRLDKKPFDYPRDDMGKQILALVEAKAPIETGAKNPDQLDKDLDKLNKELFEEGKGRGRQIQILTNKPRTIFYVAAVVNAPGARFGDFVKVYKDAVPHSVPARQGGGLATRYDEFVERVQTQLGPEYFRALTDQLRREMSVEVLASDQDKKSFE